MSYTKENIPKELIEAAKYISEDKLKKADEEQQTIQERENRRAALWSIKSTFLDLPQVKGTEFKTLKRKLRSATSPEEAQAFGIAIIIKEAEKDGE